MTGGRRCLRAAVMLAGSVVSLTALGGCSGSDAQGPTTSAPTTVAATVEPTVPDTSDTTTTEPVTTTKAPPVTTSPPTSSPPPTLVPPVDASAAASTVEVLALPGVAVWVDGVLAVAGDDDASCDRIEAEAPELDAEVATQVIAITEPTLQEMLLDFDAAAASAAELCRQGSPTEAAAEWADAVALATFIDERIAAL